MTWGDLAAADSSRTRYEHRGKPGFGLSRVIAQVLFGYFWGLLGFGATAFIWVDQPQLAPVFSLAGSLIGVFMVANIGDQTTDGTALLRAFGVVVLMQAWLQSSNTLIGLLVLVFTAVSNRRFRATPAFGKSYCLSICCLVITVQLLFALILALAAFQGNHLQMGQAGRIRFSQESLELFVQTYIDSPYDILGVDKQDLLCATVKRAYRELALKFHPDKVPASEKEAAEAQFVRISRAYELLRKNCISDEAEL